VDISLWFADQSSVRDVLVTRVGDDEKVGTGFSKSSSMVATYSGILRDTYRLFEYL